LENNTETQPSPIKGWEGELVERDTVFHLPYPSARILESSSPSARSNLRPHCKCHHCNHPINKVKQAGCRSLPNKEPHLGKSCVSLCRLISVEFARSHMRSMIRKPSSMGIAGVEPRQSRSSQTTFRDRCPDLPPLADEPQRRTTQPPTAQAAQGKLLIDHSRRTDIWGRRPGLKVTPPPLRGVDRADNLATLATQDCHPIPASNSSAP
jgi:hypothetical protein